ncbi:Ig domain-containing protein [Agarilytica rhodophyticola]|uniref:Ig domain-containing protein n=1 Tax=Agarilytica rhodophyticola TaxID=1737490 RepID=UPI000B346FE4|nr:Ig domain-containing protein [Agarilytica rhodophyticola]
MFLSSPILNDDRHPVLSSFNPRQIVSPSIFTGGILSQSIDEGQSINLDVSSYFSGSPSYSIAVSPSNPGLSISSTGVITGTINKKGSYSISVVAVLNGLATRSNIFGVTVNEVAQGLIANEPIEFDVRIVPGYDDGRDRVIYRNNENGIVIPGVTGIFSGVQVASPSLNARLETMSGTLIENITVFSKSFQGYHVATINESNLIDSADQVRLIVEVGGAVVGDGSVNLILDVVDRVE